MKTSESVESPPPLYLSHPTFRSFDFCLPNILFLLHLILSFHPVIHIIFRFPNTWLSHLILFRPLGFFHCIFHVIVCKLDFSSCRCRSSLQCLHFMIWVVSATFLGLYIALTILLLNILSFSSYAEWYTFSQSCTWSLDESLFHKDSFL